MTSHASEGSNAWNGKPAAVGSGGKANGASCSPALQTRIERELAAQTDYDWVANGRFKGGHITRHYADPGNGIDAIQLELSQRTYMDEDSFEYDEAKAGRLQVLLRRLLQVVLAG